MQWFKTVPLYGLIFAGLFADGADRLFAQDAVPKKEIKQTSWSSLPHPTEKLPFEGREAVPEKFLPAVDPPPPPRIRAGWFGEFGAVLAVPKLNGQRLSTTFTPMVAARFPTIDVAEIEAAYGPDIGFGYRLENLGELQFRYRGLYGQDRITFNNLPVLATVAPTLGLAGLNAQQIALIASGGQVQFRSRFQVNTVDAVLSTDTLYVGERWDFKLEAGGRFGSFMFEDRSDSQFVHEMARNTFSGGGPLAGLSIHRQFLTADDGMPAWLYARGEGSFLFGEANQTLEEWLNSTSAIISRSQVKTSNNRGVQRVGFEAGIAVADVPSIHVRAKVGYQFDAWYNVGKVDYSRLDLFTHGAFLRVEWNY